MKKSQNTTAIGTAYEQFVQAVYQAIIDSEVIHTIDVQQNVTVKGKSGFSHQIDVYWEYEVGGLTNRQSIVRCEKEGFCNGFSRPKISMA